MKLPDDMESSMKVTNRAYSMVAILKDQSWIEDFLQYPSNKNPLVPAPAPLLLKILCSPNSPRPDILKTLNQPLNHKIQSLHISNLRSATPAHQITTNQTTKDIYRNSTKIKEKHKTLKQPLNHKLQFIHIINSRSITPTHQNKNKSNTKTSKHTYKKLH